MKIIKGNGEPKEIFGELYYWYIIYINSKLNHIQMTEECAIDLAQLHNTQITNTKGEPV